MSEQATSTENEQEAAPEPQPGFEQLFDDRAASDQAGTPGEDSGDSEPDEGTAEQSASPVDSDEDSQEAKAIEADGDSEGETEAADPRDEKIAALEAKLDAVLAGKKLVEDEAKPEATETEAPSPIPTFELADVHFDEDLPEELDINPDDPILTTSRGIQLIKQFAQKIYDHQQGQEENRHGQLVEQAISQEIGKLASDSKAYPDIDKRQGTMRTLLRLPEFQQLLAKPDGMHQIYLRARAVDGVSVSKEDAKKAEARGAKKVIERNKAKQTSASQPRPRRSSEGAAAQALNGPRKYNSLEEAYDESAAQHGV